MPDIGDRDFLRLGGDAPEADRDRARRRACHREALAAQRLLLGGCWQDQRTEEGNGDSKGSQHGRTRSAATAAGRIVSPNSGNVMMAFAHASVPELLHRGRAMAYCEIYPGVRRD